MSDIKRCTKLLESLEELYCSRMLLLVYVECFSTKRWVSLELCSEASVFVVFSMQVALQILISGAPVRIMDLLSQSHMNLKATGFRVEII